MRRRYWHNCWLRTLRIGPSRRNCGKGFPSPTKWGRRLTHNSLSQQSQNLILTTVNQWFRASSQSVVSGLPTIRKVSKNWNCFLECKKLWSHWKHSIQSLEDFGWKLRWRSQGFSHPPQTNTNTLDNMQPVLLWKLKWDSQWIARYSTSNLLQSFLNKNFFQGRSNLTCQWQRMPCEKTSEPHRFAHDHCFTQRTICPRFVIWIWNHTCENKKNAGFDP